METFIGQIAMFGFNFNPRSWAKCDGQLLAISQNEALFSLLGTMYGGDGRTTFGLPDMRGRLPVHQGNGNATGIDNTRIGQKGGGNTQNLSQAQLPSHNHQTAATNGTIKLADQAGDSPNAYNVGAAAPNFFAKSAKDDDDNSKGDLVYKDASNSPTFNNNYVAGGHVQPTITFGNTGNSQSFSIIQPALAVNFCIALFGVYPSRS